jgi:hypothetical protein
MARNKQPTNPFYVVLLLVGVLFFVTATAYFVMMLRGDRIGRQTHEVAPAGRVMQFLDEHGGKLLAGELVLLGVCTAAAIASDGYWTRRQQRSIGVRSEP